MTYKTTGQRKTFMITNKIVGAGLVAVMARIWISAVELTRKRNVYIFEGVRAFTILG